jgi:hypothetical protein
MSKFKDLNGDGVINPGNRLIKNANGEPDYGDLKVIGNSTPRYEYGFRAGADYKGIDVSVFIQGVGKRDVWEMGSLRSRDITHQMVQYLRQLPATSGEKTEPTRSTRPLQHEWQQ